jgi:hypothetical protein
MAQDFEVTVRLRLTVEDSAALLAAAGDEVPDALRDDALVAMQVALQSLVQPPAVEQLPGVSRWSGSGWHAQVSAVPLQG